MVFACPTATFCVPGADPLVSSNHAVVELDGCLVDNGSTNGTCINGVQVEYKRKYPLKVLGLAVGLEQNRLAGA